jgi:hypothetical protein
MAFGFLYSRHEDVIRSGCHINQACLFSGRSAVRATWSSDAQRRGFVPWWGSGTVHNNAPTGAASASTSWSRHHLSSAPVASGKNHLHVFQPTKCSDFDFVWLRLDVFPVTAWKQVLDEARKQLLQRLDWKKWKATSDVKGVSFYRWSSTDEMRGTERYSRLVIVSMIEYWCNAIHRAIFEACDCIDDRVLI